jgi:hypothetical protein
MKRNPFVQLLRIAGLVRNYQGRSEFCLHSKKHSYHWLGKTATRN